MSEVTRILSTTDQGDPSAAEQLLPLVYDELLEDRGRLARLQANARGLGRPRAAFAVVEHALRFLTPPPGC